eukprot:36358_1
MIIQQQIPNYINLYDNINNNNNTTTAPKCDDNNNKNNKNITKRNTIAQAQSATGKTATFSIAQCQIHKVMKSLGTYLDVTRHACVGGTTVRGDIQQLANELINNNFYKIKPFEINYFKLMSNYDTINLTRHKYLQCIFALNRKKK